jgi:hypothetical protein
MVFCYQMIYFPEKNNTIKHDSCYGCWCCNYYTIHNDTYSVHKRGLVLWRACLPCFEASRYVYPPPLSDANCPPFPPPGGPGPPASKMAPISPGSTDTPSAPSVTPKNMKRLSKERQNVVFKDCYRMHIFFTHVWLRLR